MRMASKRARVASSSATGLPCRVVPLNGRLTDDTDMLASMSKLVAMNTSESALQVFSTAIRGMRSRSLDGTIHFGTFCTGSGLGDLALHAIMDILCRSDPQLGNMACKFVCENCPKKAEWLMALNLANIVFKDVTQMGLEMAYDWQSKKLQPIPDVQFIFFGFSCKDLSRMNSDVDAMTRYVIDVIARFIAAPDSPEFDPHALAETPLLGTTAGTLIGALQYIRKRLPDLVLMENVVGVLCIVELIREFLVKHGYSFFCSEKLDPKMFACPNHRPRIYMGGKRCLTLASPLTYSADVLQQIQNFADSFMDEAPVRFESFLLSSDSPYYLEMAAKSSVCEDTSANEKWPSVHADYFNSIGLSRPSAQTLRSFATSLPSAGMKEWLMAQPARVQEMIYFASCIVPPSGPEVAVDVSQTIERTQVNMESEGDIRLHCFTARTQLWLVRSHRLFSGREMLAMHGISRRCLTKHADDALLGDMAGNSFSAVCFLVAFVSSCQP